MQDSDRETLRKNRQGLLKDLEAKKVASRLYSREIFSEEDKDLVNAKSTATEQGECLLDLLPRKGPKAFRVFCDVLHELSPHLESLLRPVQEEGKKPVLFFIILYLKLKIQFLPVASRLLSLLSNFYV